MIPNPADKSSSAQPLTLRARTVVTMTGAPIADGAVVIEGGRILAVGSFSEIARDHPRDIMDLGEQVLLPGLINAHCHLDYTMMRNAIGPQHSFTQWIMRINATKRQLHEEDYLKGIQEGFAEVKRWGTTTLVNLEAFPELLPRMPAPPVRTWWFLEMIDIRRRIQTAEVLKGSLAFFEKRPGWLGGFGLNPHAPYTASPELYRQSADGSAHFGMLLSTHIAESAEEEAMFRDGTGELFTFLKGLGRPMDDCGKCSSFGNAVKNGLIGPGWILAHANEMREADFELIAANPGDWHVVHCPRSHAFFKHRSFPWKELEAAGVTISLGTDSLASNDSLDLFAEMRAAQKTAPWLSSEQLLATVTTHPAKALQKGGELGEISPGAHADLIALPFAGAVPDVYDAILSNTHSVEWLMLDGKLCC